MLMNRWLILSEQVENQSDDGSSQQDSTSRFKVASLFKVKPKQA